MLNRIVVVGASTGGVGALCSLVQDLPADLPAAILIVQHVGQTSVLDEILRRCHPQGIVQFAKDGETIRPGHIYIAIPDHHLVVDDGRIRLRKSPRENMHRPSVDVLFRSAARAHGRKVIGVVLTGAMSDGASGLFAIKLRNGVAIVHDPKEALVPDMPNSALNAVEVDYCLPLAQIPPLLVELANQPINSSRPVGANPTIDPAQRKTPNESDDAHPAFVCPECDGPLTEVVEGSLPTFYCKIGHRFSIDGLNEAHAETLERGLWIAVRILEDRAAIQRRRVKMLEHAGDTKHAQVALEIAVQAENDAQVLRSIMQKL